MNCILIFANGEEAPVAPANGKRFTLQELYAHIECDTVELVMLADGRVMWLDENGKRSTKELNQTATDLLREAGGIPGDFVVGNVLITDYELYDDEDDETVECSLCGKQTPADTAHLHQGKWIGDDCCWDDRLKSSE